MFALTLLGWLCFRETDLSMLWRDLTLSPWAATDFEQQMGSYLFLSTAIYALPLWIDDVWMAYVRPRSRSRGGAEHVEASGSRGGAETPREDDAAWGAILGRAVLAGVGVALILVFRSQQALDFIYFQF